jgi:hypothetical protein
MPYWLAFMVVLCCACGLDSVALTKTEAITPTPGPKTSTGASIPIARGRDNQMEDLQSCMLGHWIHSHEEDAQGVMVYRREGYNFPPSRGRIGFDFREGGELVYFGIGRADGSEQFSGSWAIEASNRVRINVNSDRIRPFVLHVVACDDQALKVRWYTE